MTKKRSKTFNERIITLINEIKQRSREHPIHLHTLISVVGADQKALKEQIKIIEFVQSQPRLLVKDVGRKTTRLRVRLEKTTTGQITNDSSKVEQNTTKKTNTRRTIYQSFRDLFSFLNNQTDWVSPTTIQKELQMNINQINNKIELIICLQQRPRLIVQRLKSEKREFVTLELEKT